VVRLLWEVLVARVIVLLLAIVPFNMVGWVVHGVLIMVAARPLIHVIIVRITHRVLKVEQIVTMFAFEVLMLLLAAVATVGLLVAVRLFFVVVRLHHLVTQILIVALLGVVVLPLGRFSRLILRVVVVLFMVGLLMMARLLRMVAFLITVLFLMGRVFLVFSAVLFPCLKVKQLLLIQRWLSRLMSLFGLLLRLGIRGGHCWHVFRNSWRDSLSRVSWVLECNRVLVIRILALFICRMLECRLRLLVLFHRFFLAVSDGRSK